MTQTDTKIKGTFYPLQHEEWLRACRELTPSQRDLLYYLRTLDPYSKGIEINCAELPCHLSSEHRRVHRQTVRRAIRKLEENEFLILGLYLSQVTQHNLEAEITCSLHKQLGGLAEVSTPAGRIDLLTDEEIIEVNPIVDFRFWILDLKMRTQVRSQAPKRKLSVWKFWMIPCRAARGLYSFGAVVCSNSIRAKFAPTIQNLKSKIQNCLVTAEEV